MWKVSAVMARHRIHYPPSSLSCPHCGGQARALFYHSTYLTRDGPPLVRADGAETYTCPECGKVVLRPATDAN